MVASQFDIAGWVACPQLQKWPAPPSSAPVLLFSSSVPSHLPTYFPGPTQINQVVSHPNQPLTITAHDDRGIRFLDNRTGEAQP